MGAFSQRLVSNMRQKEDPMDAPHDPEHTHGGSPTAVLVHEHELILQALDALEEGLTRLEAGGGDRAYFEKAVQFLRTFADRCHHGKEEDLLFKAMVNKGFPLQAGPIAVMLSEHEAGRAFIRGIAAGAAKLGTDPSGAQQVIDNGRAYIQLLRGHIAKENQILFPMAERALSPEEQTQLLVAFDRFEAQETGGGVHEASVALLAQLKAGAA
jgi:hemerythrin-like domain-containing protein